MKALLALAAAVFLAASSCSTGGAVDITGNWNYSATFGDTMPVLNCATTAGTLHLTQSGPQVTGTYAGLTFACTGAVSNTFGPYDGLISNGTITGGSLLMSFDVTGCCGGSSSWQNTGLASNTMIQGSLVTVLTLNGVQYTMFGHWNANKQ